MAFFFLLPQVCILDKVKEANPDAAWWIKGDGVDVVKGLFESKRGDWSGDVDLSDGKLQQMVRGMCTRQKFVKGLGLSSRHCTSTLKKDLEVLLDQSKEDSKFILEGTYIMINTFML